MFEVVERDNAARIGKLAIEAKTVITPSLFYIQHPRFDLGDPDFFDHELTTSFCITLNENTPHIQDIPFDDIPNISRAPLDPVTNVQTRNDDTDVKPDLSGGGPKSIGRFLVASREETGYSKALYYPASGVIRDYALLVYAGVDLFDSSQLIMHARKGNFLTEYGPVEKERWSRDRCRCPACYTGEGTGFTNRLAHNYYAALQELSVIREFISRGRLRHLVEMRVRSKPELVSILRVLDRDHYPFFRKHAQFNGGGISGVSSETLNSPAVTYYRERIRDYRKPSSSILILLPCSARKPYSLSQSHKKFIRITSEYRAYAHEMIITSPLGLVPRELESYYPPADYDISVTGAWSHEEQNMVREILHSYLQENDYEAIINHTPYDFISEYLTDWNAMDTVVDHRPSSGESLHSLDETLKSLVSDPTKTGSEGNTDRRPFSISDWKRDMFRNMWRFQFGPESDGVLDDTRVRGRFPFLKLFAESGDQLAMMVPSSRRISLTLAGGKLLASLGVQRVHIADFHPAGDIFAIGVEDADPGIHVEGEVVVVHGGEVRAVGVAKMDSKEMVESSRGVGVKVRHRKRK